MQWSSWSPWLFRAINRYKIVVFSMWTLFLLVYYWLYAHTEEESPATTWPKRAATFKWEQNFYRKMQGFCRYPDDIEAGSEHLTNVSHVSLEGILIVMRHGDRGPLTHLRAISQANCGGVLGKESKRMLKQYKLYIENLTLSGHSPWTPPQSPFHGFPLLPAHATQCQLAQLTYQGVAQMLKLGVVLNKAYEELIKTCSSKDDIVVYNTKYRRTFQSTLAFLYGFLPNDVFQRVNIQESDSSTFCFNDCACPAVDKYIKILQHAQINKLRQQRVYKTMKKLTRQIYDIPSAFLQHEPKLLINSVLSYICHNAPLPCLNKTGINLNLTQTYVKYASCPSSHDILSVFTYVNRTTQRQDNSTLFRKISRLKSYGFFKHVVQQMIRVISYKKPKIILYSGRESSFQYFLNSLAIDYGPWLRYSSRIVIEIYQITRANVTYVNKYFFRMLFDGRDVTQSITFCEKVAFRVGDGFYGCYIESIVKFLHEYYFTLVNSTNFKDACRWT